MKICGQDLGKTKAHSAIVTIEVTNKIATVIDVIQFPVGTDLGAVESYTEQYYKTNNIQKIVVDQTGMGEHTVENYKKHGLNIEGVKFTADKKNDMINLVISYGAKGTLKIPRRYEELIRQLRMQRMNAGAGETIKYTEPSGDTDDQLWSLCLAVLGANPYMQAKLVTIAMSEVKSQVEREHWIGKKREETGLIFTER